MPILSDLARGLAPRAAITRREDPRSRQTYLPARHAGVTVTTEGALMLSGVWACIDAVTKAIATSDWKIFTREDKNRHTELPDDPLTYTLNVRPNPEMTAIAFKEAMQIQAMAWGNSYAEIEYNGRGGIANLWPLLSSMMTPFRSPSGEYLYDYGNPDGTHTILTQREVYHLHGPGITGLMGAHFIALMTQSIALDMALLRFSSNFFANNTILGGILKYPKALDDKTYERLKKSWEDRHKGVNQAYKPVILEGGMDFVPQIVDSQKAQAVEARKFSLEEICRWFGVPLHKVQHIDRATFNNIEHLGIAFNHDGVRPWAVRNQQEGTYKLFPKRGGDPNRFLYIDTDWLMYGDSKTRAESDAIYLRSGVDSRNDVLKRLGRNAIGAEGDVRTVESALIDIRQLATNHDLAKANVEKALNPPEPKAPIVPPAGREDQGAGGGAQPAPGGNKNELPPTGTEVIPARKTKSMLMESVILLFASIYERYERRVKNREADLRKNSKLTAEQRELHISEERIKLRKGIHEEAGDALDVLRRCTGREIESFVVVELCDYVDAGTEPRAAAERLVSRYFQAEEAA